MKTKRNTLIVTVAGAVALLAIACGGDGPTAPSPPPPPRPLAWSDFPESETIEVGEEKTISLALTAAVNATYTHLTSNENVEIEGESPRAGIYRLTITGLEGGETTITVTATAGGYTTAHDTFDLTVVDRFNENIWRELVFDAYDCPNGSSREWCREKWGERTVEQRITSVLPVPPNFHLATRWGDWRFTSWQIATIEDAIHESVEALTGKKFAGRITRGANYRKDQYGWVDVLPLGDEYWEDRDRSAPCGAAWVGLTEGIILINTDALDVCSLDTLMLHEFGHALGFYHVLAQGDWVMTPYFSEIAPVFTEDEQFHAQLAYELGRGELYTPDPRKASTSTTTQNFSTSRGPLESIPLEEMIHCPAY